MIEGAAVHMRCFGHQQWLQRSPLSPESQQQQQQDMQRAQQEAWAARNNATSDTTTDRPKNDCRDEQSHPETHSNNDSRSRTSNPESDNDKDSDSTSADSKNIETATAINTTTNTNTGTATNDDDNSNSNSNTLTKAAPALRDIDQYTVGRNNNRVQQEDVLCSNGGGSGMHPGNRFFMSIAAMHVNRYDPEALLSQPELRGRVSVDIIREIPGRFLGRTHHNTLKPLGPRLAVRWVSFVVKTAAQRKVSQKQDK